MKTLIGLGLTVSIIAGFSTVFSGNINNETATKVITSKAKPLQKPINLDIKNNQANNFSSAAQIVK